MTATTYILTLARGEASILADLIDQFTEMLDDADATDPALKRLSPDAYRDDAEASSDFRRLTQSDLTTRRVTDAGRIASLLAEVVDDSRSPQDTVDVVLEPENVDALIRTLAALRLVVATRLGITTEDNRDDEDPRFGIYDWLGYRLEALLEDTDPPL